MYAFSPEFFNCQCILFLHCKIKLLAVVRLCRIILSDKYLNYSVLFLPYILFHILHYTYIYIITILQSIEKHGSLQ